MIVRHRVRWPAAHLLHAMLVLVLMMAILVNAGEPTSTMKSFDNLPARLFFFDDTTSALYHDAAAGQIYQSQDEGKSWDLVETIPRGEAVMLIPHPRDNSYAFVLSRTETHYLTTDRGKSWRTFKAPVPPALVANPLSFHVDKSKFGNIIYQGVKCEGSGWLSFCFDETYYTLNAFESEPELLMSSTSHCEFAHSTEMFKHSAHEDLIYCVAFDKNLEKGSHLSNSRLFSSTDFFRQDRKVEDLGIGRDARGVVAFAIVSKFAVVAIKDVVHNSEDMHLYVTYDTEHWAKAHFPHASSAQLRENAYTILDSTTYALAVDVVLKSTSSSPMSAVGTLFVSNSNGTYFVESLTNTNRNAMGYVDFERVYGVEGVGIANVVTNAEEVTGRGEEKQLKTLATFDDGRTWSPIKAPSGDNPPCDTNDLDRCSLHLHSVTTPHNFGRVFSSPAPGLVMGVGSIGGTLLPYEECDTFMSDDAGVSWRRVAEGARKYEFGDSGSILVTVDDEDGTEVVRWSGDFGRSWKEHKLPVPIRARGLTTLPDSTSQKMLLLGQVARRDQREGVGRYVLIHLDFADTRGRKCGDGDFEKWYARAGGRNGGECLMGHKQYYNRRKADADCYVGQKFEDPVEHEETCPCGDGDFECDYNYVFSDDKCVPVGPEPIEAGVCPDVTKTYTGSSGYRKIPGNTCSGGSTKDEKIEKSCKEAQPAEGDVIHQAFEFPGEIVQFAYFKESTTILVRLRDGSVYQSLNEGYLWEQLHPEEKFVAFYHHSYSNDRAYLLTATNYGYYTTQTGKLWMPFTAPNPPNGFQAQVMRFQPDSDKIIWVGQTGCEAGNMENCHSEAHYSTDNGRNWEYIDNYVHNCGWASDRELQADDTEILCESYSEKRGNQASWRPGFTAEGRGGKLELVVGGNFYEKRRRRKVFEEVVGFAKFSEFLVVAEKQGQALDLQVSMDGYNFATALFPPNLRPETHAYTVLESSTGSLFIHMTTSEDPFPYWGVILKSNSNGTYFGTSLDNVNRNANGYVDFEKVIGLDGIALVNVVGNPIEASLTGQKAILSKITHNDGSTWKSLTPPERDSLGSQYECHDVGCNLHIHGYTERWDPRATYSSPSIVGLIMAVGNVGHELAPYTESDTFLSRDAGHTWEEVHKDAHLWEFGDSGSILVMANDEEPTDIVLYSTDQGASWREYKFSDQKMRVHQIVTVPLDTSRRFILFGNYPRWASWVAVHIDFSALTSQQCILNVETPNDDDFELWSPSEERDERCLFGRQMLYHRRSRKANCYVGLLETPDVKIEKECPCGQHDFECEFNYIKDADDQCVLVEGTQPLPDDDSCYDNNEFWYERTPYRLTSYTKCDGGKRKDRGNPHRCPGFSAHSATFWWFVIMIPFGFTALVGYWYYKRSGMAKGQIRLPGDGSYYSPYGKGDGGIVDTLASVPWFLIGVAGVAWEWATTQVEQLSWNFRSRQGYRDLPVDEDAQILRFEDEE